MARRYLSPGDTDELATAARLQVYRWMPDDLERRVEAIRTADTDDPMRDPDVVEQAIEAAEDEADECLEKAGRETPLIGDDITDGFLRRVVDLVVYSLAVAHDYLPEPAAQSAIYIRWKGSVNALCGLTLTGSVGASEPRDLDITEWGDPEAWSGEELRGW